MGMGPIYTQLDHPGATARQQQEQAYQDQFNSAAYAPIPGYTGQQNPNPQGLLGGSTWNELNGRLLGDTYLPPDVSTVDVGNGWYEVHHGGQRVGTLRPGGRNGRFLNDTNWQIPQPSLPAIPTQPGGGMATPQPQQPTQNFSASGPYGRQAAQLAGLLAQPQQPQQPTGGLLGKPRFGFRIPAGSNYG